MNRIKKMDNASESIRELREEIEAQCDALNGTYGMDVFDACGIRELLYDALEKVVDDYNELEAKYQKQCGMISEYEEECQKDGEFAKFIGNQIVECIKQGAEHGYYEVHPLNRFDIHIEETSLTPMPDRHAIPKIAVQCNNVQTEMERDTAQHELEEQRERYDAMLKSNNDLRKRILDLRRQLNDNGIANYWSSSSETNVLNFNDHDANVRTSIVDALEEKVDTYKEENETLKEKLKEQVVENRAILETIERRVGVVENRAILETIERRVGVSEEMIDFISNDPYDSRVDRIITSIRRLEAQYDELKEENEELEKEKIELEDRLVQQKREDTHEISELKDKIRELKEENDKLRGERGLCKICGWRASGKRKDKTIDSLQQDIRCLKSLAMDLSGKIIHDDREDAIPDDVTTMSMCGHYYWYKKPDGEKTVDYIQKSICGACSSKTLYEHYKTENSNLKLTLLNILKELETKVGRSRIHLLNSYEDRANLIAVEIDNLKKENSNLITERDFLETENKRLKEKRSERYPWGTEKHKYKMFECPYLKDKYYNF